MDLSKNIIDNGRLLRFESKGEALRFLKDYSDYPRDKWSLAIMEDNSICLHTGFFEKEGDKILQSYLQKNKIIL